MYSFVIKIAIEIVRAVEFDITIPTPGFNIHNELELVVEADPNHTSVIFNITSSFLMINFSSYNIHCQF